MSSFKIKVNDNSYSHTTLDNPENLKSVSGSDLSSNKKRKSFLFPSMENNSLFQLNKKSPNSRFFNHSVLNMSNQNVKISKRSEPIKNIDHGYKRLSISNFAISKFSNICSVSKPNQESNFLKGI